MIGAGAQSFPEYFAALNGVPPFPWQERLAERVTTNGRWPDVLELPTGVGKTSALDIALFAHAVDPRTHPRRILLVVDRRIVVDQVRSHVERLRSKLRDAKGGVLTRIAESLNPVRDGGADALLEVAVMRGGMPRDDAWARRPDNVVLGVSTVDQIGSRLLFRGYGVSDRMSSVHAGLLGNDVLILLDEVHLAVPFAQTLLAIRDRWQGIRQRSIQRPWGIVRMSATPVGSDDAEDRFALDDRDYASSALRPRLRARKLARLVEVGGRSRDPAAARERLAASCAKEARALIARGARAVAVVVNRVATARRVLGDLRAEAEPESEAILITGRMRPLDRDDVLNPELLGRIGPGRERAADERPIIVVTTQCIEAGADFDFDGLVTECAGLDALRQRFGRLDRRGQLGTSDAVIVISSSDAAGKEPDPVYGDAMHETWRWLTEQGDQVDFGISSLALPAPERLAGLVAPALDAPVLLPSHLDAWAQTCPRPDPDPDIELWLHGPERSAPEVQIVWRADIDAQTLATARERGVSGSATTDVGGALARIRATLSACAPSTLEAVSVPIGAARAWLGGAPEVELADVTADLSRADPPADGRFAVRWAGDSTSVVKPSEIRPGDTLIVPTEYGGLAAQNWDPESNDLVSDIGDRAQWVARGRTTLRLHPRVLGQALAVDMVGIVPLADDGDEPRFRLDDWLDDSSDVLNAYAAARAIPANVLQRLLGSHRRILMPDRTWTLVARGRGGGDVSSEDDGASYLGQVVTLATHSTDVRDMVRRFTSALELDDDVAEDLALAAWFHDVGKADPRFQRLLCGGSEIRLAMLDALLAKSSGVRSDVAARRIARERSGYPAGARHELLSLAMIEQNATALRGAHDRELVLHLVASHHGWCRPFAPVSVDHEPMRVALCHGEHDLSGCTDHNLASLDSGVADRFWSLVDRYGWWGLAWLEAILRLADHRASEQEAGGE